MSTTDGHAGLYARGGKRLFDLLLSTTVGIATLPLQAVLAILVRWKLGSPVLFTQERPGLGGVPFTIIKFRTMTEDRRADGTLLPDDQRLPPFGRFLRSTSLDELPEIYNVIKGDMSVVGPRPLLMHYLPRYSERERHRHDVRPGITGWAQVNGRNNADWPKKLEMDIWYSEHFSFTFDLRILWRTAVSVVRRSDVARDGHATAPEFTGNERR